MCEYPIRDESEKPVSASLEYNLQVIGNHLRMPKNGDVVIRRFSPGGFSAAILYLDGMANPERIGEMILRPAMTAGEFLGQIGERAGWLMEHVISASEIKRHEKIQDVILGVLQGDTAVFVDGCAQALTVGTKGYEKRSVERAQNERVFNGPHEGFVENLRTNITLLRRIVVSPRMVTEMISVGKGIPTQAAVVYLDGVADEEMIGKLKGRLSKIEMDYISSSGVLEQFLEDDPFALLPQMVKTERPDRAASFLLDGMALVLLAGSPCALAAPISFFHLLHTPDSMNMRFAYSVFVRLMALVGVALTVFLPGLYLALVTYHNEVLPLALMTSIYETQSRVPVPVFAEMLFMNLAFGLITEAGSRMPGLLGQGLSVVSALVLGQAAVSADLVSPLVIIVAAVAGLGSLLVPEYGLSLGLREIQLLLLLAAALGGLYGMLLGVLVIGLQICRMSSLGAPYLAPAAPKRRHNPDLLLRYPIWQQRLRSESAKDGQKERTQGRARAWSERKETIFQKWSEKIERWRKQGRESDERGGE